MRIKQILVPVDFSEASDQALGYAIELAGKLGGEVFVAHAYLLPAYLLRSEANVSYPELTTQIRDVSQKETAALIERFTNQRVPLRSEVVEGAPHEEILSLAKKHGADLIVMGTTGRTGLAHLLIGSVAERVIRASEVPVLTVKKAQRQPTMSSLNGVPRRILVAFDFSEPAQRALEIALLLHKKIDAKVDVLHVYVDPLEGYPRLPKDAIWGSRLEAHISELKGVLQGAIKEAAGADAKNMGLHVEIGHAVERTLERAKTLDVDLLCLGTAGKNSVERLFLGSVAQQLVRTSTCPVLTVR